ncbi:MAG: cobalt-precorrin-5B (C(1))-methyltransferase [Geminicoccaceae bacterium]|nr:cobalt-precorrin-5B (C(1))-methyltransferase [Geminicoccaceae bacterium]
MARKPDGPLRTGFTTGACATAAARSAFVALTKGEFPDPVTIRLPHGEEARFMLACRDRGGNWATSGIVKDAGDDPDVTHGALVRARVTRMDDGGGVRFRAGEGVGMVTMPGLPIPPGEPAINPVPRAMLRAAVEESDVEVEISIPGGEELARSTWNPRLGIEGGLSILGTTGIVRPFSCAAWIASIHRGIDVARAAGLRHVAGCTGATTEKAVQRHYGLADHAMLDMGDFAGGLLRYLRTRPVPHVTIAGGIGKMAKLAQGARDLHSSRSQVDFEALAAMTGDGRLAHCRTALQALEVSGDGLAAVIADRARRQAIEWLDNPQVTIDTMVVDRQGRIIAVSGDSR